jgi:hypothetical protein
MLRCHRWEHSSATMRKESDRRVYTFSAECMLPSSNCIVTQARKDNESKQANRQERKKKWVNISSQQIDYKKSRCSLLYIPFFNFFPGTLISAFAVFCCGKHDYEKNIVAFFYNLLAAILQSATIFLLVGWIWSIRWGILFVQLSGMIKNANIKQNSFYFLFYVHLKTE